MKKKIRSCDISPCFSQHIILKDLNTPRDPQKSE
jgi:hypothetical protein